MEKASVNLNDYQLIGAAVKTIRGGILVGQINLLAVSTITYQKVLFGPYGARESIGEERQHQLLELFKHSLLLASYSLGSSTLAILKLLLMKLDSWERKL